MNIDIKKSTSNIIKGIINHGLIPACKLAQRNNLKKQIIYSSDGDAIRKEFSAFAINPPFNFKLADLTNKSGKKHINIPIDFEQWLNIPLHKLDLMEYAKAQEISNIPIDLLFNNDAFKKDLCPKISFQISDLHEYHQNGKGFFNENEVLRLFVEGICYGWNNFNGDNFMQVAFERVNDETFPSSDIIENRLNHNFVCLWEYGETKITIFREPGELFVKTVPFNNIKYILVPSNNYNIVFKGFKNTHIKVVNIKNTIRTKIELRGLGFSEERTGNTPSLSDTFSVPEYSKTIYKLITQNPSLALGHLVRLSTKYDNLAMTTPL